MKFKVSNPKPSVMYRVLYVPKLSCNLFSVRAAADRGNVVKFGKTRCWIRNRSGNLMGMGSLEDKLYCLDCEPALEHASVANSLNDNMNIWHQRLGHTSEQRLKEMVCNDLVEGMNVSKKSQLSFCEGVFKANSVVSPSNQWERFDQPEGYRLFTVMFVDQ